MFQKNWQLSSCSSSRTCLTGADASRKARIVAEPLERGFGVTLGNSLRRVLLSSLQGAAVTAVQIDGVVHEFSSMQGVREDVVDIVLNIKQLALRMHAEGPKRVSLRKQGPGEVKAGDIQTSADIEILNPELVLCTLDEKVDFRMELTIATGKGLPRRTADFATKPDRRGTSSIPFAARAPGFGSWRNGRSGSRAPARRGRRGAQGLRRGSHPQDRQRNLLPLRGRGPGSASAAPQGTLERHPAEVSRGGCPGGRSRQ